MNRHTSNPFLSEWDDDTETKFKNSIALNKSPFDTQDDETIVGDSIFDPATSVTNSTGNTNVFTPSTTTSTAAAATTRRSSSGQADSFSSMTNRPGLYRRNMSSFEAASLQLEQHQQAMQENGTTTSTQDDIIAKMTAEFQSAIETNDKQFAENLENLNNQFDPFETIVDDDISIPSPNPSTNQATANNRFNKLTSESTDADNVAQTVVVGERPENIDLNYEEQSGEQKASKNNNKYAHDSIDDDDAELVSTPVRNIKSSQNVESKQVDSTDGTETHLTNQHQNEMPGNESAANQAANESSGTTNTDSIAKASMFASLLASAEVTGAISGGPNISDAISPFENGSLDGGGTPAIDGDISESPSSHMNALEPATRIIKGSPNSTGDGSIDRPVSYFDPFETVIDKDALTSLMNDSQQEPQQQDQQQDDYDVASNSSMKHLDVDQTDVADPNKLATQSNDQGGESPQESAVDINSKGSNNNDYDATTKTNRPSGRTMNVNSGFVAPQVTPAKRPNKQPKKPQKVAQLEDENSSDSSEEDDRIQIVIRARDTNDPEQNSKPAIVPLLPPPPSKNSMRQARERGQVEDIPSPIMSYKTRNEQTRKGSSSSSSDTEDDLKKSKAKSKEPADTGDVVTEKRKTNEINNNTDDTGGVGDVDDDDDADASNGDDGQFVIPMRHSDDEGDDYGKPETPLYDDDTSYVLEDFPPKYEGAGWEMMLRYPPKKKLTSNRFWKKIFVKLAQVPVAPEGSGRSSRQQQQQTETSEQLGQTCMALQVFDKPTDKKPIQEIPIQATYTVSEISSQLFDQFGKIFTIKLQYIFYKERVGVRQGQLARFIHTGHISSSTTSGGHGVDPISIGAIKRMGAPIEHSPQISQIIKLGCTSYEDMKQFKECLEDCLFRMPIHRDRALSTYKTEEVQMAVRDETYIELNQIGTITKQLARVRLFFLSFLNGTPVVEVGINDIHRQGREVVGRMDILPVVTEEWIRLEAWELHSTVDQEQFENPDSRIVKLTPPDATFFELMRFRVRPPRNRELPLQISANMTVTRTKVSINCEVMVPGCVSRKHGQIPCENISIKFHMPECWIYFFREEKHFRMGSKKSVNRRPGKVKGIERFLGGGGLQDFNDESSLIEVTSGQAKYEHHHHAIVWRAARWPKESQSAYVQNTMKIRLPLTAYDKMPENFYEYVHVEYSMPATTVSHTTLRSISVNPYEDEPPEKYVKYSAKYEYKVKMRLSVNLGTRPGAPEPAEASPIIIMKQPDLQDDLQREEDSDDDDDEDQSNEENVGASN